jgi:predicted transcriptional regulator
MASGITALEARVMKVLWNRGPATAAEIRGGLPSSVALADSSIRTLLRRLERKSFVRHRREGRRFLYEAAMGRGGAAAAAAKKIVATICSGAVDALLLGMVEQKLVSREDLDALRRRIDEAEREPR